MLPRTLKILALPETRRVDIRTVKPPMSHRRPQSANMKKSQDDLSFPDSYREQAKYLKLANHFLGSDNLKVDLRRNQIRRTKNAA